MTTNTQPIPFLDLVSPHKELEGELVEVFRHALATAGFIGGPAVESFEREFALFCRTKFCVGVGSGTDALRFALLAAGVGAWDTVLTVPNTFIATTEAISQTGARPEFIDVDPRTYNMDPVRLAEYLDTNCTFSQARGKMVHNQTGSVIRAIIPVHLYGQMVEMDPILYLARKYNITVIEDACQAHGAQYYSTETSSWQVAGSMGKAAAFSFYPGKNLGACGEAGAVTTNDEEIARRIRMLRDHGQAKKYYHDVEGYNGRLDAIQAGILHTKLRHLPEWNEKRRKLAARYCELLADEEHIRLPHEPAWSKAVYHLFVIQVPDRDGLIKYLAQEGIGSGIHYPVPLPQQRAYASLSLRPGLYPLAEEAARHIVSLPMFPGMTEEQQDRVCAAVRQYIAASVVAA